MEPRDEFWRKYLIWNTEKMDKQIDKIALDSEKREKQMENAEKRTNT
jgi:hypothetical protein